MSLRSRCPVALGLLAVAGLGCEEKPKGTPAASPAEGAAELRAAALAREAETLTKAWEWEKARNKLREALTAAPKDEQIQSRLADAESMVSARVAGRWFIGSDWAPRAEDESFSITLPAVSDVGTGDDLRRPLLVAHCAGGTSWLGFEHLGVHATDRPTLKYGFDAESRQPLLASGTADGATVLADAASWLKRLEGRASGKLTIEISSPGRATENPSFDLAGAERAISKLDAGCEAQTLRAKHFEKLVSGLRPAFDDSLRVDLAGSGCGAALRVEGELVPSGPVDVNNVDQELLGRDGARLHVDFTGYGTVHFERRQEEGLVERTVSGRPTRSIVHEMALGTTDDAAQFFGPKEMTLRVSQSQQTFPAGSWVGIAYVFNVHSRGRTWLVELRCARDGRRVAAVYQ